MKLQPKVSIVMPCYNKAKYISNMLDSILVQKWDNIELILVNDGSTDGTRRIITEYKYRLLKRGFDVVIVDQENHGLPAAVYEGLKRATGEFICQVDADDGLDPEYISIMAGLLFENPILEWVVCDLLYVFEDKEIYKSYFQSDISETKIVENIAESFLLSKISDTVFNYMVRADYIKRSNLIEGYDYETRRTQEPQFVLPLAVASGKIYHIAKPLYRYIQNDSMMSLRRTYEDFMRYIELYTIVVKKTIEHLRMSPRDKKRLRIISEIAWFKRIFHFAEHFSSFEYIKRNRLNDKFIDFLNSVYYLNPVITKANSLLFVAIIDNIFHITPKKVNANHGRVIAWGVLGKRANRLLPLLKDTDLDPTELWDIAADGVSVKKPNINELTAEDTILVLPLGITNDIVSILKDISCSVISSEEVLTYIASIRYPQFYDSSTELILDDV